MDVGIGRAVADGVDHLTKLLGTDALGSCATADIGRSHCSSYQLPWLTSRPPPSAAEKNHHRTILPPLAQVHVRGCGSGLETGKHQFKVERGLVLADREAKFAASRTEE